MVPLNALAEISKHGRVEGEQKSVNTTGSKEKDRSSFLGDYKFHKGYATLVQYYRRDDSAQFGKNGPILAET
jgi:hypothetical protein